MALNPFFLQGAQSEQRLTQDLINEHLKIEKYNEMFGPDSYDQDGSRVEAAVEERRIRHMRLIPELSSDN